MVQYIAERYQIQERVGHGAMGVVYAGHDEQTNTAVAIKELKSELIEQSPDLVARFRREGEALRQLNHPNIVKMWDAVEEDGRFYLILEFIQGGTLQELIAQHKNLPVEQVLSIALDLADALTRAHRLGIIHRDLKPANVLLAADGTPRLTDFGVARVGVESDLTQTGAIVGTLAYLCPEACMGQSLDERADIWSFGVLLYEMLTGTRPFAISNPAATIQAILNDPVPDLLASRPEAGEELNDLLYRMLVKERNGRIPSVRIVAAELERILQAHQQGTVPSRALPTAPHTSLHTPYTVTPSPSASLVRHNLPQATTPFVGRQTELAEMARLLAEPEVRLVTILAPGGMGKSRLAVESGRGQAQNETAAWGGIYFIPLAPLASAEGIITAVAEALGFQFVGPSNPQEQLLAYLRPKKLLLIFDNFEHLLAGSNLVQAVLQAAPDLKLVATSRERLNLTGETVFTIGGMEFPEWETPANALTYSAVHLFMQSAQRVRVDFALQADDLRYVARICRQAQGMPLGILLAAAWVDTLSPAEIAHEMGQSLDFLESDWRDLPERQRSMRAVFGYSWQLLTAEEKATFARMALFRGGFSRTAAQAVAQTSLRLLTRLVNKSLVSRDASTGRFEIHELLRQFGVEQLQALGEETAVRRAHSAYYLQAMAGRELAIQGPDQVAVKADIEQDFENVRAAWLAAVDAGEADLIYNANTTLYLYLYGRSRFQEGIVLLSYAMERFTAETHPALFYRMRSSYFFVYALQPAQVAEGMVWARTHGTVTDLIHWLIANYFLLIERERNSTAALALMNEALALCRASGNTILESYVLHNMGYAYTFMGDVEQARIHTQASLDLSRAMGNWQRIANSWGNLGWAEFAHYGNYTKAQTMLTETVALYRQMGTNHLTIYYLLYVGWIALDLGDVARAEQVSAELLQAAHEMQNEGSLSTAQFLTALLDFAAGRWTAVQAHLIGAEKKAQNIAMELNIRLLRAQTNYLLGVVTEEIAADLEYAVTAARRFLQDTILTLQVALALAAKQAAVGELEAAVATLAFIHHHPLSHTPTAVIYQTSQQLAERLRGQLAPDLFTAAWANGRGLTARALLRN